MEQNQEMEEDCGEVDRAIFIEKEAEINDFLDVKPDFDTDLNLGLPFQVLPKDQIPFLVDLHD